MSSPTGKNNFLPSLENTPDTAAQPHRSGQKIRFEDEEAEIIRTSPFMVIRTKNRVVCGALYDRIRCLAA